MSQKDTHITIPDNIDGLEEALEKVLDGEDWALDNLRRTLKRIRIYQEYQRLIKKRPKESEKIKRELSKKYFNTPGRVKTIEYIIYRLPKSG